MLQSHAKVARIRSMIRVEFNSNMNETFILARVSPITGNLNEVEIPMSIEAYALGMRAWKKGALIQDAFPTLPAPIREFIMSGITPQEWDDMFGMGDDDVSDEGFDPYSNTYTDDC
jgi:hypothetical protein